MRAFIWLRKEKGVSERQAEEEGTMNKKRSKGNEQEKSVNGNHDSANAVLFLNYACVKGCVTNGRGLRRKGGGGAKGMCVVYE